MAPLDVTKSRFPEALLANWFMPTMHAESSKFLKFYAVHGIPEGVARLIF
jgi:hypothetical protein